LSLPAFELLRPETLDEALRLLSETPAALPIAGGTNLIPDMRKGAAAPGALINVSGLPELCCVRRKDGHLLLGAGVTIAELLDDPMVAQTAPILTEMGRSFAHTLVRNRATIGGNLVAAAPCCDSAPALLVLDAQVELASLVGTRRLPLSEFLVDAFTTKRRSDELLTCVRVPIPPDRSSSGFVKMGLRKISCMAKIDVAVRIEADGDGRCTSARVALGAVAPIAYRAEAAEARLASGLIDADAIEETARLAGESTHPRAGSEYKRQVVEALTRRLLTRVAARIGGAS
jgi:carbon-monoxide dehydrogenase medium subunit